MIVIMPCLTGGICTSSNKLKCSRPSENGIGKYKMARSSALCGSKCPMNWVCTREKGHDGEHEAHRGIERSAVARWSDRVRAETILVKDEECEIVLKELK